MTKTLEKFIEAFRKYLKEFVDKKVIKPIAGVEQLKPNYIISYNYTGTEKYYDYSLLVETWHIHGDIEQDNLVLGITDNDYVDDQFIYFKKYFQRLRKKNNIEYKLLLEEKTEIELLSIYGHSLDVNDKEVLEPIINKSRCVQIFYYSTSDYENKIMNLIKLLGYETLEKRMYEQTIIFIDTNKNKRWGYR